MLNLGILDLVIGLFFIYFILSVICTSVVEVFAQWKNLRASSLNDWITDTFNTPSGTLGTQILAHGLVDGLTKKGRIASFIPAEVFSAALLDLIYQNYLKKIGKEDAGGTFTADELKDALSNDSDFIPSDLRRFMLQALEDCKEVEQDIETLKKRVEHWYEDAMDRLTGTYKKRVRYITIVAATIVTISINADTIAITKFLKDNPQKAATIAAMAEKAAADSVLYKQVVVQLDSISSKLDTSKAVAASSVDETIRMVVNAGQQSDSLYKSLSGTGLPIGWSNASIITCAKGAAGFWSVLWCYIKALASMLVGWLATIAALTLGAPFWFDMINKVVNIRSVGQRPLSVKR